MNEAFRRWMAYCYPHDAPDSPNWKAHKIAFEAGWREAMKSLDRDGKGK